MKKPTDPMPMTRADCATLRSYIGAQLTGVQYHYLPPPEGKYYDGGQEGVDCDLAAVVITLGSRGTLLITWGMVEELKGLGILENEPYYGHVSEVLDAADREAWRHHVGSHITEVAASWHVSGEDCPESVWAIRLSFLEGSLVIALGAGFPRLEYRPDELVVVFDKFLAREYRPEHVRDSAWGSPIDSD